MKMTKQQALRDTLERRNKARLAVFEMNDKMLVTELWFEPGEGSVMDAENELIKKTGSVHDY